MKEGNVTLDELAAKLDQFGYDFDPYGYMDAVETREEYYVIIKYVQKFRNKNVQMVSS